MTTVWVVSQMIVLPNSGIQHEIVAVFSNMDNAMTFAKTTNRTVEPFELDVEVIEH